MRAVLLSGKCTWEKGSRYYTSNRDTCPILWHTLYPYFLGLVFKAKYSENGDCKVCCPAEFGVSTLVRVRPFDETFRAVGVPENWRDIIHAEVVESSANCCYGYKLGDRFLFPTFNKESQMCPAGLNNIFPFLKMPKLKCINLKKLRCPDWGEEIYYSLEDPKWKKTS